MRVVSYKYGHEAREGSITVSRHTLSAEVQEGAMSRLIVQEEQIKNLAKEAILELVREQREVLYDALAEVIPPQVLFVLFAW